MKYFPKLSRSFPPLDFYNTLSYTTLIMAERLTHQPEQPIEVEVGKTIKPFYNLTVLPLAKDYKLFPADAEPSSDPFDVVIASQKLILNGTTISLALVIPKDIVKSDFIREYDDENDEKEEAPEEFDIFQQFETPLGEATKETIYREGTKQVVKVPLELAFIFTSNVEEFCALKRFEAQLTIGDERYFLNCTNEDTFREEAEDIVGDDGTGDFYNRNLKDERRVMVNVFLPYDPQKLQDIELTILEKPQGSR